MDPEDDLGRFFRDRTTRNLFGGVCWRKVNAKSLEPEITNYFAVDLELALNDTKYSAKQHTHLEHNERYRRGWPRSCPSGTESTRGTPYGLQRLCL